MRGVGIICFWRSRLIVVIEDHELQRKLVREIRDGLRAAPKYRARVGIYPFEVVEKSCGCHVAGNPKARTVLNRSVGLKEKAAFVRPDGFVVQRARCRRGGQGGDQQSHADTGGHSKAKAQVGIPRTEESTPNWGSKKWGPLPGLGIASVWLSAETKIRRRCEWLCPKRGSRVTRVFVFIVRLVGGCRRACAHFTCAFPA